MRRNYPIHWIVRYIVTDDYGNKFYEIHKDGEIFDYSNNEVPKTNFLRRYHLDIFVEDSVVSVSHHHCKT